MPTVRQFLCAFHAKIAWARSLREKVPDAASREALRQGLEGLMRLNDMPPGQHTAQALSQRAQSALNDFYSKFQDQQCFIQYFRSECGTKAGQLCVPRGRLSMLPLTGIVLPC